MRGPDPAGPGRRLRAVFLDAGGTLIHMDRDFVIECLVRHGVACDEAGFVAAEREALSRIRAQVQAEPDRGDAERWRAAWGIVLRRLGCDEAAAAAVSGAVREHHAEGRLWTRVLPGTAEALAVLRRRGYALGVVSNADGRVERFLEAAGLRDRVDFVVDSTLVGVEKPDPRIFHIACERAGVRPDEALHAGDIYEIDVLGARAAGVDAVLVASRTEGHGTAAPDPQQAGSAPEPGTALVEEAPVLDCPVIGAVHELPRWLERGHL